MKDIEVILGNLMVSVFEQVENLEEGVHALQAFYHYSERDALRLLYDQKSAAVSYPTYCLYVCLLSHLDMECFHLQPGVIGLDNHYFVFQYYIVAICMLKFQSHLLTQ
jgi:hypothetical protein